MILYGRIDLKKALQLNADEDIQYNESRGVWVVKLFKDDYLDGIGRWIEVGEFSSKGRAESAIKKSR